MATQRDKEGLRAYMKGIIKANGVGSITGTNAQAVLDDYIDSLVFIEDGVNTDTRYFEQYHWIDINIYLPLGWELSVSGAGATMGKSSPYGANSTENAVGVVSIETGTTTSGYTRLMKGAHLLFGAGDYYKYNVRLALSVLSDGTDTYTVYSGFWDFDSADFSDSAYFVYTHSVNSGNWQCVTSNAGSATTTNTSIPGAVTFSIFTIEVNSSATQVIFKIDGNVVATHTANIPNTNVCGIIMTIVKSAGTTNRILYQDWYDLLITRATAR